MSLHYLKSVQSTTLRSISAMTTKTKLLNFPSTCKVYNRSLSVNSELGGSHVHFKSSNRKHPLGVVTTAVKLGDHTGLQVFHLTD